MKNKLLIAAFCCFLKSYGQKTEKVFLDKNDPSHECYTAILPDKSPVVGYLVLIPGFGETAERLMQQTDLPLRCAEKGILTIIPTLTDGVMSFGVDNSSQKSLTAIIEDASKNLILLPVSFISEVFQ